MLTDIPLGRDPAATEVLWALSERELVEVTPGHSLREETALTVRPFHPLGRSLCRAVLLLQEGLPQSCS